MKRTFTQPIGITTILVVLCVLFSLTPGIARRAVTALTYGTMEQQPSPVISGGNYCEALNVLFGAGGR